MKNLLRFLSLMIIFIICSCAREKISLKFNLKQGETYKSKVTMEQKISQTIQNQAMEMDQTIIMVYAYDVLDINEEGNTVIKVTYDGVGFIQDGPMGKIEYKSWEQPDSAPMMAKGLDILVGQNITIEISPRGEVVSISGINKMLNDMMEDLDLPEGGEVREQIEEYFNDQFGEESIKETMENMFAVYPEEPVGIGDAWHAEFNIAKGFPMKLSNTWRLNSIKDGKAYINVHSRIGANKDASLMQMGGIEMSFDLSGKQDGYIAVDTISGWIVEGKVRQNFEGKFKLSGELPEESQEMEWPIKSSGTILYETIKE